MALHYVTLHYNGIHCIALHYITQQYLTLQYNTLQYITLRYITLHCITLHYVTLHYNTIRYITIRYITIRYITLHYITIQYITIQYNKLHYITLHYTTLHYVTLHCITLRYVTLHYITLQYFMELPQWNSSESCNLKLFPTFHESNLKLKRLSQQPVLGALTFLRSFVAGKANFCSHLLASLVHFTVVKSQAILIIRLGVTEVIYHSSWGRRSYFRRNFIPSASFKTTKFLPRWICSGTTILRVDSAYRLSL